MEKTIVFTSVAIQFSRYQYLIGRQLQKKGIRVLHVTYSKEAANYLEKRKAKVFYLPDEFKKIRLCIPVKDCIEFFEDKYRILAKDILFEDYDFSQKSKHKAYKAMAQHFAFWECLFSHHIVDMVIGSQERYIGRIADHVCKHYGIKFCWWTRSQIPGRFVMTEYPKEGRYSFLDDYWKKNKNRKLTKKELKRAQDMILKITLEKKQIYCVVGKPKVSLDEIKFFFKRLWLNITVEKFRNPYARLFSIARSKVLCWLRMKQLKNFYDDIYDDPYLFYPLHLADDAQILVGAPQFYDQIKVIKKISKALPKGYILVVKEHPNAQGLTMVKELQEIKNIPNVYIVKPTLNAHNIISNCSGVITIRSNVGWEGLLYRKPVITLANYFYNVSGMTWQVDEIKQLKTILKKSLKKNKVTTMKLYKFVNAVIESSYPGELNFYYQYAKKNMRPENIKLIADSIYKEVLRE